MGNGVKQYIYKPEQAGLVEWPSGTLRLDGIEETSSPEAADVFVVPGNLSLFKNPRELDRLPYMRSKEDRHVLFDCSDNEPLFDKRCIFIRCNTRDWYLKRDPNTISWSWPVENFEEVVEIPSNGFRFDVSHQAWMSSQTRIDASKSCRENADLKCDIAEYNDFTGYIYDKPEGIRRRAEFRRSMRESRVALCPESIPGVFPYRFFEAMSAGRVPCLVGSGYVLPWSDRIPYSEFCIFVSSQEASSAGVVLREFIRNTPDEKIIEMGRAARRYWERWLDRDKWTSLMAEAVLEKVAQFQCA